MNRLSRKRGRCLSSEVIPNIDKFQKKFMEVDENLEFINISVVKLKIDVSVEYVADLLSADPNIEAAEPNRVFTFKTSVDFDEYEYKKNWGLEKIKAKEAWEIMPDSWKDDKNGEIVIAVLDSGVAYNHPDLNDNMWKGGVEKCYNYNGDLIPGGCPNYGWDFVNEDDDPADDRGHGTFISGIIAGNADTDGMIGVNPRVKIMAVKIGNAFGTTKEVIKGMKFAINNGAKIINFSLGGVKEETAADEKVKEILFDQFDGLFITAAGNDNRDNESIGKKGLYPCAYKKDDNSEDNIICVANSDKNDKKGLMSNWGKDSVDIYAPGEDVTSTYISKDTDIFEENFTVSVSDISDNLGTFEKVEENNWVFKDVDSKRVLFTNDTAVPYENVEVYSVVNSSPIDLHDKIGVGLNFKVWFNDKASDSNNYLYVSISVDGKKTWTILGDIKNDHKSIHEPESIGDESGKVGTIEYDLGKYLNEEIYLSFAWKVNDIKHLYKECYIDDIKIISNADIGDSNYFASHSGTSIASPHVVGVAALVWSIYPYFSPIQVKDIILETGDPVPDFSPKDGSHSVTSGKRLNAFTAVNKAEEIPALGTIIYSVKGVDIFESPTIPNIIKYTSDVTNGKIGVILRYPEYKNDSINKKHKWYNIYWGKNNDGEDIIGWSYHIDPDYTDLKHFGIKYKIPNGVGLFSRDLWTYEQYKLNEKTYRYMFLMRYFDEYESDGYNNLGEPFNYNDHGFFVYSQSGIWIQNFKKEGDETALILNMSKEKVFLLKGKLLAEYIKNNQGPNLLGAPTEEEKDNDTTIIQKFEKGYLIYDKISLKTSIIPYSFTGEFSDTKDHWAKKYINYVANYGVIDGDDGTFGPQKPVTRGELVKMCYKGAGKTADPIAPDPGFSDVSSDHWVYKYLADAKKKGYIYGREDGTFGPDDPVDRYEAAKIIYNIFDAKDEDINVSVSSRLTFPDVPATDWPYKYVNWFANIRVNWEDDVKGVRIASGYNNGNFGKDDSGDKTNISRAEMSKIIANCMNLRGTGPKYLLLSSNSSRKSKSLDSFLSNAVTLGFSYEQIYDNFNVVPPEPIQYPNQSILENENLSHTADKIDSDGDKMFYFWNTTGGSFTTTDNENCSNMTWTPPDVTEETTFVIRVERGDGKGKVNYGMFKVMVTPVEDFNINSTEQKILASDGGDKDYFGSSVSISGGYAIVEGDGIYIYKRIDNRWVEQNKISMSCYEVAISGDYFIIGKNGMAYIFKKEISEQGEKWIKQSTLLASDNTGGGAIWSFCINFWRLRYCWDI